MRGVTQLPGWRTGAESDRVAEAASTALGRPVRLDGWRPSVQGAVGHVVGVADDDGTGYVVKLFPPEAGQRAETEVRALRLVLDAGAVPVPEVVATGPLPALRGRLVVQRRLEGVRWADRRASLGTGEGERLLRDVAGHLAALHRITHDRFGGLTTGAPRWDNARERQRTRSETLLRSFVSAGGPRELAERVSRFVSARSSLFGAHVRPVLCHHDVNGGNVVVSRQGRPLVQGIVDFERASWDDPLADVALTALHLRHHGDDAEVLLDAYGVSPEERPRLHVHSVLLVVAERAWVAQDKPPGWADTLAKLDAWLAEDT